MWASYYVVLLWQLQVKSTIEVTMRVLCSYCECAVVSQPFVTVIVSEYPYSATRGTVTCNAVLCCAMQYNNGFYKAPFPRDAKCKILNKSKQN